MSVTVFMTSVSGCLLTKKRQEKLLAILESKKIEHTLVDISQNSDDKDLMRMRAGDPTALPPQICNGDIFCGDYTAFENAVEMEDLEGFLHLKKGTSCQS